MVATIAVFENISMTVKSGQDNISVCFSYIAKSSLNRQGQNRLNLSYLRNNKMLFAILLVVFFNFYQATSLLDG